ncbi:MAG: T9SS type A sorting domain-containing protein [Aureispira sp.]|nr:T9SS type A sorting domain-containing protein [Aureispira sp.]
MKAKYWIIIFLCLSSLATLSTAQGWEKIFVESSWGQQTVGRSVLQTADGGYLASGNYYITPGSIPFLIKTDANGTEQWRKEGSIANPGLGAFGYKEPQSYKHLLNTSDGHYLIAGEMIYKHPMSPVFSDTLKIALIKIDIQGNVLWAQEHGFNDTLLTGSGEVASLGKITNTSDGGYVMVMTVDNSTLLSKIDVLGNIQWSKVISNTAQISDLIETSTGEFVAVGRHNSYIHPSIIKADAQGNLLWQRDTIAMEQFASLKCIVEAPDGNYVVGGSMGNLSDPPMIFKLDTTGARMTWGQINIQSFNSPYMNGVVSDIDLTANGEFVITGSDSYSNYISFIARVNAVGQIVRARTLNHLTNTYGTAVKGTNDGGCIVVGTTDIGGGLSGITGVYIVKTDSTMRIPSCTIEGNIYNDADLDCTNDLGEINLKNWIVQLTGRVQGVQQTIYTTTDTLGNYTFQVDTGAHTIVVNSAPLSVYWQACQDTQTVLFGQYFQADTVDFAMQNVFSCPLLQVDISTPLLRRCIANTYYVTYTNLGGSKAQNAYVEVELDSFLIYNSSSLPLISQVGRVFRFDIGDVEIGEQGSFSIDVTVDCNNTILGQAHCVEAHIYPDTVCIPNYWNGPIIDITATCLGDSIRFDLNNSGAAMPSSADYIVTEDHIMLKNSTYQLGAGGQTSIYQQTQTGATYRMIADQVAGFPLLLGDPFVTASIEGCDPYSNGTFNTGFVTNVSNGNASPYVAVDCQQNVDSYDPNDKQAQPVGYDLDHFIEESTALDYKIRFQNTGTAPAIRVRVVDTLSEYLDPSTIEVGASSHPYTWKLYGGNRIEFMCDNIMLPDSNTNEPASHGFIKFRIQQKAGNSTGTRIENSAAIYFDYNAPVLTNTTWHTIGNDFIISNVKRIEDTKLASTIEAIVTPNPMSSLATIQLKGMDTNTVATLSIFDALGQRVEQLQSDTGIFQLVNKGWSSGMYIYQIQVNQELIGTGKIIVR